MGTQHELEKSPTVSPSPPYLYLINSVFLNELVKGGVHFIKHLNYSHRGYFAADARETNDIAEQDGYFVEMLRKGETITNEFIELIEFIDLLLDSIFVVMVVNK